MKTLSRHLKDYLKLRRQLGFKFYVEGSFLHGFVRFARKQRARFINTRLALRWATLPANITQRQRAQRLGVVRRFAEYLTLVEPRTEVPPQNLLLPGRTDRNRISIRRNKFFTSSRRRGRWPLHPRSKAWRWAPF